MDPQGNERDQGSLEPGLPDFEHPDSLGQMKKLAVNPFKQADNSIFIRH
jgi:hypothetical protein